PDPEERRTELRAGLTDPGRKPGVGVQARGSSPRFAQQPGQLSPRLVHFGLHARLGIRAQDEVVLVGADRPLAVAGEGGEPALFAEEHREKDATGLEVIGPPPHRRQRAAWLTMTLPEPGDDEIPPDAERGSELLE